MTLDRIDGYLQRFTDSTRSLRKRGWHGLWPTHRQSAVFADRGLPKPETRGEAAEQIRLIAEKEGWGR